MIERIEPDIFDDKDRMARAAVDLDLFDAMRGLLELAEAGKLDLDDLAAVEAVVFAPEAYRHIPETFRRYVDLAIASAKANLAAGGLRRNAHGEEGFIVAAPRSKR